MNDNLKYFVVVGNDPRWGIYSFVLELFQQVLYAVVNGYIPVFDTKTLRYPTFDDGTDNPFYSYFAMPDPKITIDEVYQLPQDRVKIGTPKGGYLPEYKDFFINFHHTDWIDEELLELISPIFNQYVGLSEKMQLKANAMYDEIFPKDGKVVGVNIRYCYKYVSLYYPDNGMHSRVFEVEELGALLQRRMQEWGYKYVYIICDDREYLDDLKTIMGNAVIYNERPMTHFFHNGKPNFDEAVKCCEFSDCTAVESITQYISEVELLARCDSILGNPSSAMNVAILRNGGRYEYIDLYDLGMYELK